MLIYLQTFFLYAFASLTLIFHVKISENLMLLFCNFIQEMLMLSGVRQNGFELAIFSI